MPQRAARPIPWTANIAEDRTLTDTVGGKDTVAHEACSNRMYAVQRCQMPPLMTLSNPSFLQNAALKPGGNGVRAGAVGERSRSPHPRP